MMEIFMLIMIAILGLFYIGIMAWLFFPFDELFPDRKK